MARLLILSFCLAACSDPPATGLVTGTVAVAGSDAAQWSPDVAKQSSPKISVDKNLEFPYVAPTLFAKLPIIVSNVGKASLRISTVTFQVDAPFSLFQDRCDAVGVKEEKAGVLPSGVEILPGELHQFCVKFTPTDDKKRSGFVTFHSDDPANPNSTVPILANTDVPCIKLTPYPTVHFGVKSGLTESREIQIQNCGGVELVVDSMVFTAGTNTDEFTLDFKKMIGDTNNKCVEIEPKMGPSKANACTIPITGTAKFDIVYSPADISPLSEPSDPKSDPVPDVAVLEVSSNAYVKPQLKVQGIGVKDNCPIAVVSCKEGEEVVPQTLLHMIGTASKAKGGNVIKKYAWTVKQPVGSNQALMPGDAFPTPNLFAKSVGTYTFCLDVWDNNDVKSCISQCLDIVVVPENAITVQLLWNTPADQDKGDYGPGTGADLDLHFAHLPGSQPDLDCDGAPDPWFSNPFDCFWFQFSPPWGSADPAVLDDPVLDYDYNGGGEWGSEWTSLVQPESDVAYPIAVHDYNDYGFGKSLATVSVYIQSVLVLKVSDTPMNSLDMWYVGNINWPNKLVGGPLEPLTVCKQSGDACLAKKDPSDPKGGKMWQASGDFCITPCYYRKDFDKKPAFGSEALCKSK